MPTMLADHVEKNNLQGQLKYSLFVGASSGAETENRWADLNMIERRSPHQVGKSIAKGINNGNIKFFDKHLSMFPVDLVYGFYTKDRPNKKLDVVIVEATAITEDGGIVPGASVGASPELIQMADKVCENKFQENGNKSTDKAPDYYRSQHIYALLRRSSRYHNDRNPTPPKTIFDHGTRR